MSNLKFSEVPEISPNKFGPDNSVYYLGIPQPCHCDIATGDIAVDDHFYLIGWSRKLHSRLMNGREGSVAIMLFSEDSGEVWQHFPLDEEYQDDAEFQTKKGVLK